jgi:hypothetical protein
MAVVNQGCRGRSKTVTSWYQIEVTIKIVEKIHFQFERMNGRAKSQEWLRFNVDSTTFVIRYH